MKGPVSPPPSEENRKYFEARLDRREGILAVMQKLPERRGIGNLCQHFTRLYPLMSLGDKAHNQAWETAGKFFCIQSYANTLPPQREYGAGSQLTTEVLDEPCAGNRNQ